MTDRVFFRVRVLSPGRPLLATLYDYRSLADAQAAADALARTLSGFDLANAAYDVARLSGEVPRG